MKENVKNVSEKQENMKLNSVYSKKITSLWIIYEFEIFEKFDNLSEDELNTKNNKEVYAKNDVLTSVIKRCRAEKKRGERKIDAFRRKLMTPGSEIRDVQNTKSNQK